MEESPLQGAHRGPLPRPVSPSTFDRAHGFTARSELIWRLAAQAYGADYPEEVQALGMTTWWTLGRCVSALRVGPGRLLVDLACGRGGPGLWLSRATGADLIGVDWSPVAVEAATNRAAAFVPPGRARSSSATWQPPAYLTGRQTPSFASMRSSSPKTESPRSAKSTACSDPKAVTSSRRPRCRRRPRPSTSTIGRRCSKRPGSSSNTKRRYRGLPNSSDACTTSGSNTSKRSEPRSVLRPPTGSRARRARSAPHSRAAGPCSSSRAGRGNCVHPLDTVDERILESSAALVLPAVKEEDRYAELENA